MSGGEPTIDVGLLEQVAGLTLRLDGAYRLPDGRRLPPGELRLRSTAAGLEADGAPETGGAEWLLTPEDPERARFAVQATIGLDFHWQRQELQVFRGALRLLSRGERLTLINRVPLEIYLASVIGSEMNAAAPAELARAHAVISRSWLLAQLEARGRQANAAPGRLETPDEIVRWTDRTAHADFDVCADDHCQRYQGVDRAVTTAAARALADTRGWVLTFDARPCDARFSKCCGGVSEDFRTAWEDRPVPYLVPRVDGPDPAAPLPDLTGEEGLRRFLAAPPPAWCDCTDPAVLDRVLNDYDRATPDFFRWQIQLKADEAGQLVRDKLGRDLGRLLALEPVERGPSGRLRRLRLVGERGRLIIGKELEIRRALSPSHLYSSAFAIDPQGPPGRPEVFLLRGAGWGHGVGLCQIGAAVMACRGLDHRTILRHYYPGTTLERLYA